MTRNSGTWRWRGRAVLAGLVLGAALPIQAARAQVWSATPVSGNWLTAANWVGGTVPNSSGATATFGSSGITDLTLGATIQVGGVTINAGASPFTFSLQSGSVFDLRGAGIVSLSANAPIVNLGASTEVVNFFGASTAANAVIANHGGSINFLNAATAGSAMITNDNNGATFFAGTTSGGNATFTNSGGETTFTDTATAGSATITNNNGGATNFVATTTAGNATITNNSGSLTEFQQTTTAGSAHITITSGGIMEFIDSSTAGNAVIANNVGGTIQFTSASTAGSAAIANGGGTVIFGAPASGAVTSTASAGSAVITNTNAGLITFETQSTGGNATITNTNGSVKFQDNASAGSASIAAFGSGTGQSNTVQFFDHSTAGNATLTAKNAAQIAFANNASAGNAIINTNSDLGRAASMTVFSDSATAGSATLNTDSRGSILFSGNASGGSATFNTNNGGVVTFGLAPAATTTAGSINGSGTYDLTATSLTVGATNADSVVTGTIKGVGGALIKAGLGTMTLDGVNTYTGGTQVTGGTLVVGDAAHAGASLAGDVMVATDGTLAGHGTINGAVNNEGVVAPGGTIGTLTAASFAQGAGGTLAIEVSPATASQLKVVGAASLAGTLALVFDPGIYTPKSYALLTAASISGGFATTTGAVPTAGLVQAVKTGATEVDLVLTNAIIGTSITVTPTNDTIETALTTAAIEGSQRTTGMLFDRIGETQGHGVADVRTALGAASRTQIASIGAAENLTGFLAELPDTIARSGGWFRAVGTFGSVSHSAGAPDFDAKSGGFLGGIDRPIDEHTTLGIAAGYTHTDVTENTGGSGAIDTPRLDLYGSYALGGLAVDAVVGYGYDRFEHTRPTSLGSARGAHDGHELTGAVQGSYPLSQGSYIVTPTLGLQYTRLFATGFGEDGAGGFDLTGSGGDTDSLRPFIGVSAQRLFATDDGALWAPELRAGYSREVLSNARTLTVTTASGAAFLVNGISPSRDQVTLGAAFTVRWTDTLKLFADYDVALPTGNQTNHTISAGLHYKF